MTIKILQGDCIDKLKTIANKTFHTCVTSPPYWGLRDYGTATWIGGDPNCPHYRTSHTSDKCITGHKKSQKSGGIADSIYKTVCPKCGAVRQDRQLGLEETPQEYVANMVQVFREVRRVLRDDGTLWLNLGDTYYNYRADGKYPKQTVSKTKQDLPEFSTARGNKLEGLKSKDLIGIPWRVAFALQEDGWYLRQDIIWNKPNPMP
jgi:DNA modification methylase